MRGEGMHPWGVAEARELGPEADARRERAYPLLADEPRRWPDLVVRGPDSPSDEEARRRFLAED